MTTRKDFLYAGALIAPGLMLTDSMLSATVQTNGQTAPAPQVPQEWPLKVAATHVQLAPGTLTQIRLTVDHCGRDLVADVGPSRIRPLLPEGLPYSAALLFIPD